MTRCGFGYPISPGSRHVFFCDDDAVDSFTQPIPGSSCVSVQVRVCDAHAEWLRFEYLLRRAVSSSDPVLPCVCGDSTAPGVHHRLSGPCHVDLGVETYEVVTGGGEHVDTIVMHHVHTEAECGHTPVPFESYDGLYQCDDCDQLNPREPWCGARCNVFHAEVVESVKLAEREGDFPAYADETMIDRED